MNLLMIHNARKNTHDVSMNDNHRALIAPEGGNVNDVIYANYEKDDVSFTNDPIDTRFSSSIHEFFLIFFCYHHKRKSNVDSQGTLKVYRLVAINLQ